MVLQAIRDRLHGIIAIFIFAILIIPFAFVGVNSYFTSDAVNAVATVNEEEITISEYSQSFQNFRRRMQAQQGNEFNAEQFEQLTVRREFLDQLIDETLISQLSLEAGLDISDEVVASTIRSLPGFEVDGEFNADVYQQRLAAQGMTPTQFEREVRASLVLEQLPNSISQSSIATQSEIDEYIRLSEQKREFSALIVPAMMAVKAEMVTPEDGGEPVPKITIPEGPEVTDEAVQSWYDAHQGDYLSDEAVIVEYIELDAAQLGGAIEPDEEQLRARFEEQQARFVTPESRLASHILIEVESTAPQADIDTARQQAEDLAVRARNGEDFATLAGEYSQDIGSAAGGGDLGWVQPGYMVQAFEEGLYELTTENPISDPVQSGFGWHVIQLRDIRPSEGMTYAEARELLLSEYQAEADELRFLEQADRMIDIIYQDPTTLSTAADELGLQIQEVGPFGRAGEEIGVTANAGFVTASFSDLVLAQRSVSDPVDLGPNHIALILLKQHLPESLKPLEEVREQVVQSVRSDLLLKAAEQKASDLLARIEAGESFESLSAETGLVLIGPVEATRRSSEHGQEFVGDLFRLPLPQEGSPVRQILRKEEGYAVVQLDTVTDGSAEGEIQTMLNTFFDRQISNAGASIETLGFVRMLREQSVIEVFEDRL